MAVEVAAVVVGFFFFYCDDVADFWTTLWLSMFRGFGSWPIGNTVLVGTVHPGYAVDTGAVLQLLSAVEEDTGGARDGYIYICGYDAPPLANWWRNGGYGVWEC